MIYCGCQLCFDPDDDDRDYVGPTISHDSGVNKHQLMALFMSSSRSSYFLVIGKLYHAGLSCITVIIAPTIWEG